MSNLIATLRQVGKLGYKIFSNGTVYNKFDREVGYTSKLGYRILWVHLEEGQRKLYIHRLVAAKFLLNPDGWPQVNHIDGNKENNRIDNLEWCTQFANNEHARRTGLWKPPMLGKRNEECWNCKAIVKVEPDGRALEYPSIAEAYRAMGRKRGSGIQKCLEGKRLHAYGCEWRYA